MSEGRLTERSHAILRDLRELAERRVEVETRLVRGRAAAKAEADQEHERALAAAKRRHDEEMRRVRNAHERSMRETAARVQADVDRVLRQEVSERETILEKAAHNEREARRQYEEAVFIAETLYEESEKQPAERCATVEQSVERILRTVEEQREALAATVARYRQALPAPATAPAAPEDGSALERLDQCVAEGAAGLERLRRLVAPRLFIGGMPLVVGGFVVAAGAAAGLATEAWRPGRATAIGAGAGLVAAVGLLAGLRVLAGRRVRAVAGDVLRAAEEAATCADRAVVDARARRDEEARRLLETRDREVAQAKARVEPVLREIAERRDHYLARIEEKYPKAAARLREDGEKARAEAVAAHEAETGAIAARCARETEEAERAWTQRTEERETAFGAEWRRMEDAWRAGMESCASQIESVVAEDAALFRAWSDPAWSAWTPPRDQAPSMRIGRRTVDRARIPGSIPEDPALVVPARERFELPIALDLPHRANLVVRHGAEGRTESVGILQTAMLRLLTLLPPGKVRFTVIDPVGLGQSFAGLMHLADHDDKLVTGRIWTEPKHIDQRLTDLTEHMENVIQKYLRNEFETIADYNVEAGEIAEPYRFLVISDFPAKFTEHAARRLASILASGPRCGVHVLVAHDEREALPPGIAREDLERGSLVLVHGAEGFRIQDEVLGDAPLEIDDPPPEAFVTDVCRKVGEAAKDATRVEVPFAVVAPPDGELWARTCDSELRVPLGRSGATKLQELAIGVGTSQHVLLAGKTGSGKSTLLHVLVTNIALWYSPDEVELYLIDFKKGVEFKTYATHVLPHARAVAVESDREFGLSVLQRVDAELKARGDRYRALGVQDLAGYRRIAAASPGHPPLPRVLLVIDEFQEMFVEDDKIGQDAALLLDRIVRQGRAFGIHVLLGSQTLGGAYSLARATMGQMQVRIALQCSEADSYLIMSEDNAAARLLSRPGEAIYNDAGGAIEGNSPFQIVWLSDVERDRQLDRVSRLAARTASSAPSRREPPIVFEGNAPAELSSNHQLGALLAGAPAAVAGARTVHRAWLGEAIAIKGPTAATFRRQSGANLLVVGQQDESALAMMVASMVSIAAQSVAGAPPRFVVLDGTPADSPLVGVLPNAAAALGVTHEIVAYREVEEAFGRLAQLLEERSRADATDAPPLFVLIHALQRFRMLRATDDFSFSMDAGDKPPTPDKVLGNLLRDGPPLGMHVLTWCDTQANLSRTLERQGLREFEMRVLFQMGAADSTALIDSPVAMRLGMQRALYHSEEEGVLEKFRPYALPTPTELAELGAALRSRAASR